jgi:hypothetical protein
MTDRNDKPPPKTPRERWEAMAARRKELGLKRVANLWAHPEDHAAIKEKAAELTNDRFNPPAVKRPKKPKPPKA